MNKFPIISINESQIESLEQLGTKAKFWLTDEKAKYLFKMGRPDTGDDWVEVVVTEICNLLDIPHAKYSFAKYGTKNGTNSLTFVPNGGRLVHGNELLATVYKSIDIDYDENRFYKANKYDLKIIHMILNSKIFLPAINILEYEMLDNAFDIFIGYLVLDCFISNQDRHHENWGLIVVGGIVFIAPTYDHASGLGSIESDEKKEKRLNGNDYRYTVKKFVEKATTPFYNKGKKVSTYESIILCGKLNKPTTLYWLERIETINLNDISNIFAKIPNTLITDISIQFAIEMLKENKNRLLNIKRKLENE